jgi:4-alpha-glucanotransferase
VKNRGSGILLHISSLPSQYGIGDLGPKAYEFADFLSRARQKYWQVLPVNQVEGKGNYSPYDSLSAFAGNTMLISPALLLEQGLLTTADLKKQPAFSQTRVDYRRAESDKARLLNLAYKRFKKHQAPKQYQKFCSENKQWLEDYTLFTAIRNEQRHRPWSNWRNKLRDRKAAALKSARTRLADEIDKEKFLQYIFFDQWFALKRYCNKLGIRIIGDIPIYVSSDAVDIWTYPRLFKLTKMKKPRQIGGVPPDRYTRDGQLWGNTVYNWKALEQTGYNWWLERIAHNLKMFDILRLDHFRGFLRFWEVPAGSGTARNGWWTRGPGDSFFDALFTRFSPSRFIAEDLGYITADVREAISRYKLASMKVLVFGFDGEPQRNPHFPANYPTNSIAYTSVHDTNTLKGWFKEAGAEQRKAVFSCLSRKVSASKIQWEMIKVLQNSASNTAVVQMQDILGLGVEARMNKPGSVKNNWTWRLVPMDLKRSTAARLARLTRACDR